MIVPCICLFIVPCISVVFSTEFSLKGDPCAKHDSCYSKPLIRTCSCDEDCHLYGTCCADVQPWQPDPPEGTYRCYSHRTATPVFVKKSCSEEFQGHVGDIAACLDEDEDEMDVKNNILVTSHKTKITYWNTHCAACNNEAAADLELWNIEVYCPLHDDVNRNLIRRNLTFDQEKSQWGLQIGDEFLQCIVKYAPPPYIDEVKHCTPNLITSCPPDYSGKEIVKKCSLYYAERKVNNSETYYKNIHCAVCNKANIKQLECPGMFSPEDDVEEADFGEMVEEIFMRGDWLYKKPGKMFECSAGYVYDPFQTRCRKYTEKTYVVIESASHALRWEPLSVLLVLFVLIAL